MIVQISAIIVPPADVNTGSFEKYLHEEALPDADRRVLTRITRDFQQSVLKGEDIDGGRCYYLWRAELDLVNSGPAASRLDDELWSAMRRLLAAQDAVLTTPLTSMVSGGLS